MFEYEIIKNNDFYFPRTDRWIMDTFNLKLDETILYKMIMDKEYVTWTVTWMANIMNCSDKTITRILDKFIDMEIMIKRTISPNGAKKRCVYVALYNENGKLPDNEVKNYIDLGLNKILLDYGVKRYYRKRKTKM